MQFIIDLLIFISLILFYARINKAIAAIIKSEEHLRLLAYQGTKRDHQDRQVEELS